MNHKIVTITICIILYTPYIFDNSFAVHGFTAFTSSSGIMSVTGIYTITIANTDSTELPKRLGSLTIDVPPSFTALGIPDISPPPSKSWTCSLSDLTIKCKANNSDARLNAEEILSVSIAATPTTTGRFEWTVTAFHFRGFTDEITMLGTQPMIDIADPVPVPPPPDPELNERPNIILILTDDQQFDTIKYMPTVQKLAEDGVLFTNAFVSTSLCCPSRASILTGQYAHNHGLLSNKPSEGGGAENFNDKSTIGTWLNDVGYDTGYIGKYFNRYNSISPYIAVGWDHWHVFQDTGYYSYTLNEDGIINAYGTLPNDYSTDVLAKRATEFIATANRPFFLMFSPLAAHVDARGYAVPAPRHEGTCNDLQPHRPPSFNEADVSDKPSWIADNPLWGKKKIIDIDLFRERQICSLKAVDDAVANIIQAVGSDIENTAIIFTSDNGFQWGEHRLKGKNCIYDECNRIPFVFHYTKLASHMTIDRFVQNIDIAPTIADLANIPIPPTDGRSFVSLLIDANTEWRDIILLEYFFKTGYHSAAVRTYSFKYVELGTGERELYNMQDDPYELNNLIKDRNYEEAIKALKQQLNQLLAE